MIYGQRVESVLRQKAVQCRVERMPGLFRQVRGHDEGLQLPLLTEIRNGTNTHVNAGRKVQRAAG